MCAVIVELPCWEALVMWKAVRGRWHQLPACAFLCPGELPVRPSAALLQSCYCREQPIDIPATSWRGKVLCHVAHHSANLESSTLHWAPLETCCAVWLSALFLARDYILAPLKRARLSTREVCSRNFLSACYTKIYGGLILPGASRW